MQTVQKYYDFYKGICARELRGIIRRSHPAIPEFTLLSASKVKEARDRCALNRSTASPAPYTAKELGNGTLPAGMFVGTIPP